MSNVTWFVIRCTDSDSRFASWHVTWFGSWFVGTTTESCDTEYEFDGILMTNKCTLKSKLERYFEFRGTLMINIHWPSTSWWGLRTTTIWFEAKQKQRLGDGMAKILTWLCEYTEEEIGPKIYSYIFWVFVCQVEHIELDYMWLHEF